MLASGPPIASGYRGSRRIATLEDFYGPDDKKNRNRNNKQRREEIETESKTNVMKKDRKKGK